MRTTLTIDDDIAVKIDRLRRGKGYSLRDIINRALRAGLERFEAKPAEKAVFRTETASLGRCRIGELVDVDKALVIAEGEDFK